MKFIRVTTKDVGSNGLPKLFAINIEHIVTVEPVLWKPVNIDIEGATQEVIEGTNIVVQVNAAHVIEVESRDTFDAVLHRIELADGTVQNLGDGLDYVEPEPQVEWKAAMGHYNEEKKKDPLVIVDCCCGQRINTTMDHVELQPNGRLWHGNALGGGHAHDAVPFGDPRYAKDNCECEPADDATQYAGAIVPWCPVHGNRKSNDPYESRNPGSWWCPRCGAVEGEKHLYQCDSGKSGTVKHP